MKKQQITLAFSFFFLSTLLFTNETYTGNNLNEAMIVRAPVWVFLEPQPGTMTKEERGKILPPRKALIDITKMLMSGMIYGWKFSYTPFDKKRKVTEEFELTPIHTINETEKRLHITELKPRYPYLYCWAEYHASDEIAQRRIHWLSCKYITAKGLGKGERKAELDGIYHAYRQALRSAVRGAMRKKLKNKPRCVIGELLIKNTPRLYMTNGEFNAELTVYLYVKEIIPYTVF